MTRRPTDLGLHEKFKSELPEGIPNVQHMLAVYFRKNSDVKTVISPNDGMI